MRSFRSVSEPNAPSSYNSNRASHMLAEQNKRKEMMVLFDELLDQLPTGHGIKANKWDSQGLPQWETLNKGTLDMLCSMKLTCV